ncbi:MAG: pilus assembly protein PilZ, partial [Pseudomonadota bacterium]
VAGKVIWVTPPGSQGNRVAGIGVQFNEGNDGEIAKSKIENILAGMVNADRPTHTM